jgi:hypothetical protein
MRARRASLAVTAAVLIAVTAPVAALAHKSVEDHKQDDASVPKTPQEERALTRETQAATAADARVAAAAVPGAPDDIGTWSPVEDWPVVGVHVALLPNGKVLAYDSVGDNATETYPVHDHTRATVWDPATHLHTDVRVNTGFNVFCSGLAHLLDGSVFLAGGNKNSSLHGIDQTHTFNHTNNTWTLGARMGYERWYPTVTGLRNGEMLITEGGPDIPEVRQRDGSIRRLTTASRNLPLYPWLDVAPDGRAFYSGPDQTMRTLNPDGTGAWQSYGNRDTFGRDYGGHAMYAVGKILVAGGGSSRASARVIDVNGASPTVSSTGSMQYGRRQNNLTLLADGTALTTGGNSSGAGLVDMSNGVYAAELWNPGTGTWKTLAAQRVTRQYHSTALLLPDGRVLSSGGGICGTCDQVNYLAKNAEVFTPPYLYKQDGSGTLAPRPTVTDAPATINHATSFAISTPEAASIAKVGLVRLGAVTHSVDMDQRYVPLSFTAGSGTLTATAPANANIAPPGPYMLFVVDSAGVPSVAKMVTVNAPPAPPPNAVPTATITSPANNASFGYRANVTINASASDSDGTVRKVEFFRNDGATKLGEDTTAPYSYVWQRAPSGTHSLRAKATDNTGAVGTSARVSIRVRGLFG